jgi:peptidoglycan/xylan/chitin deacetylase (PgdA/CDA1 family)
VHPLAPFTSTNLILLFHIVPSADWFADTLRKVKILYKFISAVDLEAYYHDGRAFNGCCHISFDDGERTVYENAFPVLRDMRVPATVFVSPRMIDEGRNYWFQEIRHIRRRIGDERLRERICEILGCERTEIAGYGVLSILKTLKLADITRVIEGVKELERIGADVNHNITRDQLLELAESNVFTVGAHTLNHPILSNESDEDAEREIRESIRQLSDMLNRDVRIFSYPNGTALDYGAREQSILRQQGIKLAVTETVSFFRRSSNPLAIPRAAFSASGRGNRAILPKLLLLPAWSPLRTAVRLGRTEARERMELKKSSFARFLQ